MILQRLTEYYETLLKLGKISPPGWENAFKVSYGLELAEDGTLVQLIPYREEAQRGKKTVIVPRSMRVPAHAKRSSGVAANFLCDNSTYMLGVDAKGKPERSFDCFTANAELHREILARVDSPAARAILHFFERWQPADASTHPLLEADWKEITAGSNLIFCYQMTPLCDDSLIAEAWQRYYDTDDEDVSSSTCLVTGRTAPVATLHPSIKGVRGAQATGASLVSFNAPAFESYGHEQGQNAPVSKYAAFAYTTALNYLLADWENRQIIGDTTVVCWAKNGGRSYQNVGMLALFGTSQDPAKDTEREVRALMKKVAHGDPLNWDNITLDPSEPFYILGISPNASRLSVRFFLESTFGDFMKNIRQHYDDIAVVRPSFDNREYLPLYALLNETVNQNAKDKSAAPQLAGEVLRSVLTGIPYPATLLTGAELRIHAEREITRGRAAIIKGYYTRHPHNNCPKEVLQMELNEACTNIPYTLGRIFCVYEQIQYVANPKITTTIKDTYFNAASGTPAHVFPRLGNLAQKHLRVLRRDKPGAAVNLERSLAELLPRIGCNFPKRLDMPAQGAFQLGYYFESQKRMQKKETTKEEPENV